MRTVVLILLFALTAAGAGCAARRDFIEANVGWHSPSYSVIFGTLQQLPGPTQFEPIWTIRFGGPSDAYLGQLALTPGEKLIGYSGGERVEVRGHLLTESTTDSFNGRWYRVESVQMWSGHR